MTRLAISFATVLFPFAAAAHPDHASGGDFGIVHFLTDPFHVGLLASVVVLALAARRPLLWRAFLRRRRH